MLVVVVAAAVAAAVVVGTVELLGTATGLASVSVTAVEMRAGSLFLLCLSFEAFFFGC